MGQFFVTAKVPKLDGLRLKNGSSRKLFNHLVAANPDLRIERTADGEVIVMAPAHSRTGNQNARLTAGLSIWADANGTGQAFDSSAGYDLPNGANRGPDASWVLNERLQALTPGQRDGFLPLCPDFVIELRSKSDRFSTVKAKMQEYIENGAKLGWLIDLLKRSVFIYRPGVAPEHLTEPESVSADPELPGFTLSLNEIWNPGF